jgi:high affinity Mn2+ porin
VNFPGGAQRFDSDLAVAELFVSASIISSATTASIPIFSPRDRLRSTSAGSLVMGQTTFIEQYAAAVPLALSRPVNSLDPNQGRESWDAMFAAGAKLWRGAEFWVDPEIDQGFGLSNTAGIAGFPSGASFKVGASVPYCAHCNAPSCGRQSISAALPRRWRPIKISSPARTPPTGS